MLRFPIRSAGVARRTIARVISADDLPNNWAPTVNFLVGVASERDHNVVSRLLSGGLTNVIGYMSDELTDLTDCQYPWIRLTKDALEKNDVVSITPAREELQVLLRASDTHHTVFLTNRCNSSCIMCSQPPTSNDDSWLIDESIQIVRHLAWEPKTVGFTGGEPTLLSNRLRDILELYSHTHSGTTLEVLSNGRALSDAKFARELLLPLPKAVWWMVPLYGHAALLHDSVVRAEGAFDETIGGLMNLHRYCQFIQLRVVLILPVLEVIADLCEFIARNLPFVQEVALMGCEPRGYAKMNRDECELDIKVWIKELERGIQRLEWRGVRVSLMNLPLCALPPHLHSIAQNSISDWKKVYGAVCSDCQLKNQCCGLFASHERGWLPTRLRPFGMSMGYQS